MTITLPHVFQDGVNETASGVQVNEDLNVLKAAIEAQEGKNPSAANKYTAAASLAMSSNVVLDASHWTHAVIRLVSPKQTPTIEAKVSVGGKEVAQIAMVGEEAQRFFAVSVHVAPGEAVRVDPTGAWTATVSYRLLGT